MNNLTSVTRATADLFLSEATVDTAAPLQALRVLKDSINQDTLDGTELREWLDAEHFAGGVLLTAATMNKRAEVAGKGDPFNRVSRSELIQRFLAWASQLTARLEAVQNGTADLAAYRRKLAAFREDPVRRRP